MRVHLDGNATTPMDPRVLEAMRPFFLQRFGNPDNTRSWHGVQAGEAVEKSRVQVAALIGARPEEILFTSGATEANNLALQGVLRAIRNPQRRVITQATEHSSILKVCRQMESDGVKLTVLPVDRFGRICPSDLHSALETRASLVSIMFANNEIGTIQDLAFIARQCREHGVVLHTDATQAVGRVPVDVSEIAVDLLSLSAHKLCGPMGVGCLYVRRGLLPARLAACAWGGKQELGMRPGTLNVPGIVGLGEACRIALEEMSEYEKIVREFSVALLTQLRERIPDLKLNGHPHERLPDNLNLCIPNVQATALMSALEDLSFSSGSACTSHDLTPSHVLTALGLDGESAECAIRLGVGRWNTPEQIGYAADRIAHQVEALRAWTRPATTEKASHEAVLADSTRVGNDQPAPSYTRVWYDDPVIQPLLDRFGSELDHGDAVLDAGCGPGRDAQWLQEAGFDVVGVDTPSAMLAEAHRRVKGAVLRTMDVGSLHFPPGTFEGIWACASLVYPPQCSLSETLSEMFRVLKAGGKLFISIIEGEGEETDEHGHFFIYHSPAEFEGLLETAGFRIIDGGSNVIAKSTQNRPLTKRLTWRLAEKLDATPRTSTRPSCVFCSTDRFHSSRRIGMATASSIIWGNDHLYVVPDLAPLVEGHLLIVSNRHHLSFGGADNSELMALELAQEQIRKLFYDIYGCEALFWEHGSSTCMDAGSCIDHAHVHCLPLEVDLKRALTGYPVPELRSYTADFRRKLTQNDRAYLYFEEKPGDAWITEVGPIPSQFFRRVIVTAMGREQWRWQDASQSEEKQHTYNNTLRRLASRYDHLHQQRVDRC